MAGNGFGKFPFIPKTTSVRQSTSFHSQDSKQSNSDTDEKEYKQSHRFRVEWENDQHLVTIDEHGSTMTLISKSTGNIYRMSADPVVSFDSSLQSFIGVGEHQNHGILNLDGDVQIHLSTARSEAVNIKTLSEVLIFEIAADKATLMKNVNGGSPHLSSGMVLETGKVSDFRSQTGIDFNTSLQWLDEIEKSGGLMMLNREGRWVQLHQHENSVDCVISDICYQLSEVGYHAASEYWSYISHNKSSGFFNWLQSAWFNEICNMYGNPCGLGCYTPCAEWPLPGCNSMSSDFYKGLSNFSGDDAAIVDESLFTGPDIWALMAAAQMFNWYSSLYRLCSDGECGREFSQIYQGNWGPLTMNAGIVRKG
ncbi:hypothetical protein CS022_24355 [Veronia nyctiphanis]|uniref:Uncharacterized protein n=1 Tax=Veronia nyctiphanis TaxID=1278244 RepID=A0A4Q0YBN7_9GAMM|nr:hypothetical protein [Veronia nyctiphanis]RXJ67766.1 hypothetical protein CS022_24355 [Veronia nyctiphanis]